MDGLAQGHTSFKMGTQVCPLCRCSLSPHAPAASQPAFPAAPEAGRLGNAQTAGGDRWMGVSLTPLPGFVWAFITCTWKMPLRTVPLDGWLR